MMKKILFGIAALCLAATVGYCQEKTSPLQLTIKSDKQVYEVGEEISLTGYFKSSSSGEIYIVKDYMPLKYCRLKVSVPGGNVFEHDPNPWQQFAGAPPSSYIALKPNEGIEYFSVKTKAGESMGDRDNWSSVTSNESSLVPFVAKGVYEIRFEYINLTPTKKDALKGIFTSNPITIEVFEKGKNSATVSAQRAT